ncbi:Fe-S cluster assembly protein SufD [Aureibacter tunicatorum]|uniref:Fe-S cluster assembly protein SufD n=1 Tax=Aureibacter tunicatorum TaxID=866807 RepID=A0AAE3XN49_9BACT|nr:Fe-S cluster assembly protein SufD [Aureibacter tunicatorum]MDR6239643.1 Fe-S cluster assembly protein SufD [Aureibacter tunicatorum]BDD04119.1 Fe-S cluster assembly protein SufD [Aureibacter tunicatorum]
MSEQVVKKNINEVLLEKIETNRQRLKDASNASLDHVRGEAAGILAEKGLPSAKNEEYRYLNISKNLEKRFDFSQENSVQSLSSQDVSDKTLDLGQEIVKVVLVNGVFSETLSDISNLPAGLNVSKVSDVLLQNPDKIASLIQSKVHNTDEFQVLNTAMFEEGVFVEVEKNAIIDQALYLEFINDTRESKSFNSPRSFVQVGQSAQLNIVENHLTVGEEASFTNIATEIYVAPNANLKYYKLQNDKPNASQVNSTTIHQERDSVATTVTVSLDGDIVRNNLGFVLHGEGCLANMYGLSLVDGNTVVDHHTTVDHTKAHCDSNELYKGIYGDRSKGVFNGKIFVRPNAQKTNAFQSNKNILLTDDATINTKPQLEIWADDVKCSHGCTNGQLDDDQLFYLRARGIGEEKARSMLLFAFAEDVLENISFEPLKEYIENIVASRFE